MSGPILFIVFLAGIILLVRTSGWLVSLLTWMARYLKLSEYIVAFVLMAGATSIPELFIGINSAISGVPSLSLGNVLGANLLDVTLVIGITALILAIPLDGERIAHEAGFIFTLTIAPLILLLDGTLSRADGAMLIFLFIAYLRYLFVVSRPSHSTINTIEPTLYSFGEFVKKLFLFFVGTALLLVAARVVVFAAEIGTARLGLPTFLVGLIVISLGTTLPELTFGIRLALAGRGGLGFGNAIGSVVFNLLLILGLVALIQPITIGEERTAIFFNLLVVTAVALILHITIRLTDRVPRWMGAFLVALYVAVAIVTFQLSVPGIL